MKQPLCHGRELARLRNLARSTRGDWPVAVLLTGDRGSGKTTILEAFGEWQREQGWAVLQVAATAGRGNSLRLLPDLLEGASPWLSKEERQGVEREIREILHEIRAAGDLFPTGCHAAIDSAAKIVAEPLSRQPLAILIDDAELAEEVFFRLIGGIVEAVESKRLAVASCDKESLHEAAVLPWTWKPITLDSLPVQDLLSVVEAAGGSQAAKEAAKRLVGVGLASPHAGVVAGHLLASNAELPSAEALKEKGLEALWRARLESIEDDSKRLIEMAAVSSSGINAWRLKRLGDFRPSDLQTTEELRAEGWLKATHPGGKLRLVLARPELADLVLGGMDAPKQEALHERFAEIVAADDLNPAVQEEEVAHHLHAIGREEEAVARLVASAEHYVRQGALSRAEELFREAIGRLGGNPDLEVDARVGLAEIERRWGRPHIALRELDQCGQSAESCRQAAKRYTKRAEILIAVGHVEEAAEALRAARAACPDEARRMMARIDHFEAGLALKRGDLGAATDATKRAAEIATALKDDGLLARVFYDTASIQFQEGELHDALASCRQALALYRNRRDSLGIATTLVTMGNIEGSLGLEDDSLRHYTEAGRLHQALSNVSGYLSTRNNIATIYMERQQHREAEALFRECLEAWQEMGDDDGVCVALINLGSIAALREEYRESLELARQARTIAASSGRAGQRMTTILVEANALQGLGRLGEALRTIEEAEEIGEDLDNELRLVDLVRSKGHCLCRLGALDAGKEELARALETAQLQNRVEECRNCLDELYEAAMARKSYQEAGRWLDQLDALPLSVESEAGFRRLLRIKLEQARSGGTLPAEDRVFLEGWLEEGAELMEGAVVDCLAEWLPDAEALPHARRCYEEALRIGNRDSLWRDAKRLGEIETRLGLEAGRVHCREAAEVVLEMAAELGEEEREIFLSSFGRRSVLRYAAIVD